MRQLIVLSVLIFFCLSAFGQNKNKVDYNTQYIVYGALEDHVTRRLPGLVKYELLSTDSLVLFTGICNPNQAIGDTQGIFIIPLPDKGTEYFSDKYLFRFSLEGYQTLVVEYTPGKLYKNEPAIKHKPIRMRRAPKERQLDEATVTATKVKFYSKDDTLVFNADAFQLAEGSMLDALIKQLPGVELHSDGRIFVNGRYVENLLLNGEDFFKRDRSIMLDNLPSYMVQNVQVYDKQGRMGEMLGRNVGDAQLVMDVRLKKQYSIGWMANAEGAYGTQERYFARLFGLRYTNQSRLSFFGLVNNVNETRKPGEETSWTPQQSGTGLTTIRYGGADYLVGDRRKRFKIEGSADVRHADDRYNTQTSQTNFLSGGDTYGRSGYVSYNHSLSLNTNHSLEFNWLRTKLRTQPSWAYNRSRFLSHTQSATSSERFTTLLDSLFSPEVSATELRRILNRTEAKGLYFGNWMNFNLPAQASFNLPHSINSIYVEGAVNASNSDYANTARRIYEYPANGDMGRDVRHEYGETPAKAHSEWLKVSYVHFFENNWRMTPYYKFENTYYRGENMLYRLDRLDEDLGWNELPSVEYWRQATLDGQNSVQQTNRSDYHVVGMSVFKEQFKENFWRYFFDLPLSFDYDRVHYVRPSVLDTMMRRHNLFIRPSVRVSNEWHKMCDGRVTTTKQLEMDYSVGASAYPMHYAITLPNTSNPLSIQLGNDNLRNSWSHQMSVKFSHNDVERQRTWNVSAAYRQTMQAVVMGYVYDPSTGRQTFTPDNVNGNYTLNGQFYYALPLDKPKHLSFSTQTSANYNHNVDLISVSEKASGNRSVTHNLHATETLKLNYRVAKINVGITSKTTWSHLTSRREDFKDIDAFDLNNGVTFQWDMPANFQISTDLNLYTRRGYDAKDMNTNDVVWNMRIAKRLLRGKLTLMADGFDLFHQISNVRRSINGQGLVETRYLSIPRYVMVHAIYRLSKSPKTR